MVDTPAIQPNLAALGAYDKAQRLKGSPDQAPASFGDALQKAAMQSVDTVRRGDTTATAGLTGAASMQQVVEATMAMESTVRVSVAVRDKLVEAYQEIMRMPL